MKPIVYQWDPHEISSIIRDYSINIGMGSWFPVWIPQIGFLSWEVSGCTPYGIDRQCDSIVSVATWSTEKNFIYKLHHLGFREILLKIWAWPMNACDTCCIHLTGKISTMKYGILQICLQQNVWQMFINSLPCFINVAVGLLLGLSTVGIGQLATSCQIIWDEVVSMLGLIIEG